MSTLEMRQLNSLSKQHIYQPMRQLARARVLGQLFQVAISVALLPLDNTILVTVLAWCYLSSFVSLNTTRRREVIRDVQFRPKTILVTGVNTPYGLRVARIWYNEGHRVVGADITESRFASGESKSMALVAYYRIPKPQYVSRLLDIVLREKVDIWIPCSQDASVADDSTAKQAIESRTSCKCITLDPQLSSQWSQSDSFLQYLTDQGLPAVENHQVLSRDSIHKILHRSPTKTYHIRQSAPAVDLNKTIVLPKRTLSLTYLEVSEIQISKDSPWLMQQHARLGEFTADLIVIRGHVVAIMIRPANRESVWGSSPLNNGLAATIHRVIEKFASKGGSRINGHFSVRLMVDEERISNSVRYEVRIADCTQGAATVTHLLQKISSRSLVNGYLAIISKEDVPKTSVDVLSFRVDFSSRLTQLPSLYLNVNGFAERVISPTLRSVVQNIDKKLDEADNILLFWANWRFAFMDPLPWWWHAHVYSPLTQLDQVLDSIKQACAS
ncbi:uncharacterized protein BDV14DRAFT_105312 [Aspergillus stella-maris]|uniref:uncharacterized protein n=1 Tax=Aspergillus stella-maris TaxID=1810926 RepID=UPI003CCD78A8